MASLEQQSLNDAFNKACASDNIDDVYRLVRLVPQELILENKRSIPTYKELNLNLDTGIYMENCFYTGSTIDILFGLLYLNTNYNCTLLLEYPLTSNKEIEKYKLYSHIKLTNHNEYLCLEKLWYLESKWNYRADNKQSSAYGIPQLLKLKTNDPYKQIDLGLIYIAKRYGTPCKALAFHLKTGHY